MTKSNHVTNLFNKEFGDFTSGTIAINGRARIEKTDDGRLCVVIDGVRYSASRYDLFGMNDNPQAWLDAFVKEFDKETAKEEFNSPLNKQIDDIETKMAENTEEAKKSRTIQERIKEAIKNANLKFHSFLAECGVHLRSSLNGEKKQQADNLYKNYWTERFALTTENNYETLLLASNCSLASEKGKAVRQAAMNNFLIERA